MPLTKIPTDQLEIARAVESLDMIYVGPQNNRNYRYKVNVADWHRRPDELVDVSAYTYNVNAADMGMEPWRVVDSVDKSCDLDKYDIWRQHGTAVRLCLQDQPADFPLYVEERHFLILHRLGQQPVIDNDPIDNELYRMPEVRSEMLGVLCRALQDNRASGTRVMLGSGPAVRLSIDIPLPMGHDGPTPPQSPIISQVLTQWLWGSVDAKDIAADVTNQRAIEHDNAMWHAREGKQEVHLDPDCGSPILDEVCAGGPLTRIARYQDGGDSSVGIQSSAFWKVVEDENGPEADTGLARLLKREQQLRQLLVLLRQRTLPAEIEAQVRMIES